MFKYQGEFAAELAEKWEVGQYEQVKLTIRQLKNKSQAAYIAARVAMLLAEDSMGVADEFVEYIHPNM